MKPKPSDRRCCQQAATAPKRQTDHASQHFPKTRYVGLCDVAKALASQYRYAPEISISLSGKQAVRAERYRDAHLNQLL